MRTIAIIPCRGGSVGIPRKNLADLAGKPLLAYTIEQAQEAEQIDQVVVSTEDGEIGEVALEYGATVIPRPSYLSHGDVMVWEAVRYVAEHLQAAHALPDLFVELHTTYPFRTSDLIDRTIKGMEQNTARFGCCMVASRLYDRIWRWGSEANYIRMPGDLEIKSRQKQEPLYLDHYGLANVYTPMLALQGNPYKGQITFHFTESKLHSFDIDDKEDLELANLIMEKKLHHERLHRGVQIFPPACMGL